MLAETCKALNNWFDDDGYGGKCRLFRSFTISGGEIEIPEAQEGQYFRICDSVFNDGVYKYPASGLTDETFDGVVWLMRIPKQVIDADTAYDEWKESNADVLTSPYQSESFGGYSYTKAYSGNNETNNILASPFADRVLRWRKL